MSEEKLQKSPESIDEIEWKHEFIEKLKKNFRQ